MAKVKVITYSEIPEGGVKKGTVDGKDSAFLKMGGDVFATANICTHEACYIDENSEVREDVVECTCHGSQFDIRSGEVLLPPAIEPLETYKTEVVGEEVFLEV